MAVKPTLLLLLFSCLYSTLKETQAANILAIFPHTGKSHFFMFKPFVYKLAERGHHVTVMTHFPDENPPKNVKFVSLHTDDSTILFNSFSMENLEAIPPQLSFLKSFMSIVGLRQMGLEVCESGLSHPNVQNFIKEKQEFDLSIVEFFNTDCFASFAHIYRTPIVGIFSSVMMPWHNDRFGNPDNPSYISNHFLQVSSKMAFFERFCNTFLTFFSKLAYYLFFDPPADALVEKYLGKNIPPVREIAKNSSLFLVNTHFTLFQPRPLVPGVIELGGFHVSPPLGKIPVDVLKFIEASPNGVIFFSMGSTIKGSTMPLYKLKIFQNVLGKLPQRILWKWEDDVMPGKSENVFIGKWFPQNEILAHPNVILFVTHSGLMGTEEAVYHGVPMLMLPIFGDQPVNAASCAEKGIGVILDYYTMTEESLKAALYEILTNKRYAQNSKALSRMFLDRPLSIMDTAIYWTEYVIKYRGAPQLRSAAADLPWYQEYLLDVLAAYILIFYIFKTAMSVCLYMCCKKTRKEKKLKKSKKA